MSIFWSDGDNKIRPGIYRRNKDIGKDADDANFNVEIEGEEGSLELFVTTDGEGNVYVTAPGWAVTYDGEGNVEVYAIPQPIAYNQTDGVVMIGG